MGEFINLAKNDPFLTFLFSIPGVAGVIMALYLWQKIKSLQRDVEETKKEDKETASAISSLKEEIAKLNTHMSWIRKVANGGNPNAK